MLASPIPLFLGAVLCNWAYATTYEIQWTNFASWLVAGGLVFVGAALVWTGVGLFSHRGRRGWISLGLVLAAFVFGFITALFLARDAWAAMPGSLILSIITLILVVAANWAAYSGSGSERRA
ncbi:hypothetical protein JNO53_13625 [Altererythrobacter sp. C41]|nr:hypothetical protein [Altererythrobacter sp. C41]